MRKRKSVIAFPDPLFKYPSESSNFYVSEVAKIVKEIEPKTSKIVQNYGCYHWMTRKR